MIEIKHRGGGERRTAVGDATRLNAGIPPAVQRPSEQRCRRAGSCRRSARPGARVGQGVEGPCSSRG